jgi:ABC-type dipeptide/oligopeptide/nickel transport system ATPase component
MNLSILLVAHDLAVVKNVCDRVYVMERGLFVDSGETCKVFNEPTSQYTKKLLSAVPTL